MLPEDSQYARKTYLDLVKLANRLTANDRALPVIRVAILGEHATQQWTKVFRAVLYELGIWAEIYEAEFDSLQQEILDPESGMHQFDPNYVWVCLCSQQYRRRFLNTAPVGRRTLEFDSIVGKARLPDHH
jgi:predicted enzyme involved in methoxymalonyl-ACP biosynthesis